MDEGGELENKIWTDLCSECRIKLQFRRVGAHTWVLERRDVLARGINNRLFADDRFPGQQVLSEVQ